MVIGGYFADVLSTADGNGDDCLPGGDGDGGD